MKILSELSAAKICRVCGESLPLTEFYKHPEMADGHLGKCKECTKRQVRENRNRDPEKHRLFDRTRATLPERRAQMLANLRVYKTRHRDRYKARMATSNAIRDGRINKQPCCFCGETKVEAHHADYSRPLEITWVCKPCHYSHFHRSPF